MSNRIGAAAACSVRAPAGTSRDTIVTFGVTTVPALAKPGRASPIAEMSRSFFMEDPGRANRARPVLRVQVRRPSPNTILTGVKKAVLLAFCVLAAVAAAPAPAAPAHPRVLVVH